MRVYFNTHHKHVIVIKTKEYLTNKNIKVDLWGDEKDHSAQGMNFLLDSFEKVKNNYSNYNLVHTWSIIKDYYPTIKFFKEKNIPQAVSTFYWPFFLQAVYDKNLRVDKRAKMIASELLNKYNLFNSSTKRKILAMADIVLPNSVMEGEIINKYFNVPWEKIHPVYDGSDERFYKANPKPFEEKYGLKDFVLFSGRCDKRKNLLLLIKIMKELKKDLVIIGEDKDKPGYDIDANYYYQCKNAADKNIYFIGKFNYNDPMLASAYAAAHTVVLPSWVETPGVSVLDGALAGANVVVTSIGSAPEYFQDYAWYVKPWDKEDIKNKIIEAQKTPKTKELANMIKKKFTWERTAEETLQAYKKIIK